MVTRSEVIIKMANRRCIALIYQFALNISLIKDYEQIAVLESMVSDERKKRIDRYRFDKDKVRCLIAEMLLRYALYMQYGIDSSKISFRYKENGKPFLTDSNIRFNLSHSGEWVVCALGNSEIGIDVEEIKAIDFRSVYQRFSGSEIQLLDNIKTERQSDPFYRMWTLKESYVKYNGLGLRCPFESFSINFDENEKSSLMKNGNYDNTISLISSKVDENHWYAVCTEISEKISEIKIVTVSDLIYALFGQMQQ